MNKYTLNVVLGDDIITKEYIGVKELTYETGIKRSLISSWFTSKKDETHKINGFTTLTKEWGIIGKGG